MHTFEFFLYFIHCVCPHIGHGSVAKPLTALLAFDAYYTVTPLGVSIPSEEILDFPICNCMNVIYLNISATTNTIVGLYCQILNLPS